MDDRMEKTGLFYVRFMDDWIVLSPNGFDFLGYSFEPKGLSIAPKTLANFLERKTQLCEQVADVRRIGQYVRNWYRWVRAGVELGVSKLNVSPLFVRIHM
jgi:RNA-directed DNA polymerase